MWQDLPMYDRTMARRVRWGGAVALTLLVLRATVLPAQAGRARPPPSAAVLPPGHGWFCIPMPGATGVCERTLAGCQAAIASMPWGGLPPACAPQPSAFCATYTAGQATSPPNPAYACRVDLAGCQEAIARVRAATAPPAIFAASRCAPVP
jgi:hypothetical protein